MSQFPDNPRVGDVVRVPANEEHNGITQIILNVSKENSHENFYGEVQTLTRLPSSERKYLLKHVVVFSEEGLEQSDPIRVTVSHFPVESYVFIEDCGWTARELGTPIVSFDRKGQVLSLPSLMVSVGSTHIHYNEIVVDLPPEDKKEEKE